jgi:hypothetical protein
MYTPDNADIAAEPSEYGSILIRPYQNWTLAECKIILLLTLHLLPWPRNPMPGNTTASRMLLRKKQPHAITPTPILSQLFASTNIILIQDLFKRYRKYHLEESRWNDWRARRETFVNGTSQKQDATDSEQRYGLRRGPCHITYSNHRHQAL